MIDAGLPHLLIGGQAVNLLDERRVTFDLDFTVIGGPGRLEALRDRLLASGFALVQSQSIDPGRGIDFIGIGTARTCWT